MSEGLKNALTHRAFAEETSGLKRRPRGSSRQSLEKLLIGEAKVALPTLPDLLTALGALYGGRRPKSLVQAAAGTHEFALQRSGTHAFVSCYERLGPIHVPERKVPLQQLVRTCARAVLESPTLPANLHAIAERLLKEAMALDPHGQRRHQMVQSPETQADPNAALNFSFEAALPCQISGWSPGSSLNDHHALLFNGRLTAHLHGRKFALENGPFFVLIQRALGMLRQLLEAWRDGNAMHEIAYGAAGARLELRLTGADNLIFKLRNAHGEERNLQQPSLRELSLPFLRVAGDLLRSLVELDRTQQRNLRVRELRQEVRSLRRLVRDLEAPRDIDVSDASEVRLAMNLEGTDTPLAEGPERVQRLGLRWGFEVDGIDALATYLIDDNLIVSSARRRVALDRLSGRIVWEQANLGGATLVADRVLLELMPEGSIRFLAAESGEHYATAKLSWSAGAAANGVFAGGEGLAPLAVLPLRNHDLVALDLRSGSPVWAYATQGPGPIRWRRIGRVLCLSTGDGALHALDAATGEVLWRRVNRGRFFQPPTLCGDTIIAAGGHGERSGDCLGLDPGTGEVRWRAEARTRPLAAPVSISDRACAILEECPERTQLRAIDSRDGATLWTHEVAPNNATTLLARAGKLLMNDAEGRVQAIDGDSGQIDWWCQLADPMTDHVPRRLEIVPVRDRLYVPASQLHALDAATGAPLEGHVDCELVPDVLKAHKDSGWVYAAEESGYVKAFAPVPTLRLIHSR